MRTYTFLRDATTAPRSRLRAVRSRRYTLLAPLLRFHHRGQPSDFGNFYELYAIAAAVLGGCSLRGGEGSILGLLVGTALMVVLQNMINLVHPGYQNIEFAIVGGVILAGVVADELVRRLSRRRPAP